MVWTIFAGRGRAEEPEWLVWLVAAVTVVVGWLIGNSVVSQLQTTAVGSGSVTYPAGWVAASAPGAAFAAADLIGAGPFGPRVEVRSLDPAELLGPALADDEPRGAVDVATALSLEQARTLPGYRLLTLEAATVQGREAARLEFAYLADGPQGSAAGAMPALMRAVAVVAPRGDGYAVLTYAAEAARFDALAEQRRQVLASWRPG